MLLASTNYINLAAVCTMHWQREIGIRKAMGASAARLASQFVAESLLVAMLATLIGLSIAWLALPLFSELVNRPLTGMFTPASCAATLLLGALVGIFERAPMGYWPLLCALGCVALAALAATARHTAAAMRMAPAAALRE